MANRHLQNIIRLTLSIFVLVMVSRADAQAQRAVPPLVDSSVAQIMAAYRQGRVGLSSTALYVLCQMGRSQPSAILDELADSLTNRAIEKDPLRGEVAAAVTAHLEAAVPGRHPDCRLYQGVHERLLRIHRESPERVTRIVVLEWMLELPDRAPVLTYLREVAISNDPSAGGAVEALMQATRSDTTRWFNSPADRQRALDILRDLYENNMVRHGGLDQFGSGAFMLSTFGRARGWVHRGG